MSSPDPNAPRMPSGRELAMMFSTVPLAIGFWLLLGTALYRSDPVAGIGAAIAFVMWLGARALVRRARGSGA